MIPLIILCCFAMAAAKPSGLQSVSYSVPSAFLASQYHTQDSLGQYSYGYSAGSSAKAETKTLDGVTRGGYSYLDGNGVVQTANYVADDVNGFQVAATNVAHDTPEVSAAKLAHAVAYNEAAYAAATSPDVGESVVVTAPLVASYVSSPPAVSVVKEIPSKISSYSSVVASPSVVPVPTVAPLISVKDIPSKAFSYSAVQTSPSVAYAIKGIPSKAFAYSAVEASPSVSVAPLATSVVNVKDIPSKAFSYSTVEASPSVAVAPAAYVVKDIPSKAFSYSTVEAAPSVAVAPAAYVVKDIPSKAFSYSTVEASPSVAAAPALTSYPVVTLAKNAPAKAFSYSTVAASPSVSLVSAPAAVTYSIAAQNVPIAVSAPSAVVTATSHQYHTQDALGQYSYGYAGGPSAKVETKTLDGVTRGGYSYVDGNGIVQSASYVADDVNGFRVAATNIPVGPNPANVLVSPAVSGSQVLVAETPEVVAAKVAHVAAVKHRDHFSY